MAHLTAVPVNLSAGDTGPLIMNVTNPDGSVFVLTGWTLDDAQVKISGPGGLTTPVASITDAGTGEVTISLVAASLPKKAVHKVQATFTGPGSVSRKNFVGLIDAHEAL